MENHGFPKNNQKKFFKFFFLEHVSHYIMFSICGKNFSLIGLTVSEISKWSKKRGGTLNRSFNSLFISINKNRENCKKLRFDQIVD